MNTAKRHDFSDIHTHILPGLDDGSPNAQTSIFILSAEYSQGIGTVVFTPHFYARESSPAQFLKRREQSLSILLAEIRKQEVSELPVMITGAEVLYFEGMSNSQDLSKLCISGTDLLLLEMPYSQWTSHMLWEIAGITEKLGIVPIIAHLDRYIKHGFAVKEIFDMNVIIQLNAESVLNKKTSRCAIKLLKNGQAELLASDCHNNSGPRAPILGSALKKLDLKLGPDFTAELTEKTSQLLSKAERIEGMTVTL